MRTHLLELLTRQIVAGDITVEQARATVLRRMRVPRAAPLLLREFVDLHIKRAVIRNGGCKQKAARELGIGITTVHRRMRAIEGSR
jgi:transcriptional regulator of acetoin/glycerol metabolism